MKKITENPAIKELCAFVTYNPLNKTVARHK